MVQTMNSKHMQPASIALLRAVCSESDSSCNPLALGALRLLARCSRVRRFPQLMQLECPVSTQSGSELGRYLQRAMVAGLEAVVGRFITSHDVPQVEVAPGFGFRRRPNSFLNQCFCAGCRWSDTQRYSNLAGMSSKSLQPA